MHGRAGGFLNTLRKSAEHHGRGLALQSAWTKSQCE